MVLNLGLQSSYSSGQKNRVCVLLWTQVETSQSKIPKPHILFSPFKDHSWACQSLEQESKFTLRLAKKRGGLIVPFMQWCTYSSRSLFVRDALSTSMSSMARLSLLCLFLLSDIALRPTHVPWSSRLSCSFSEGLDFPPCRCLLTSIANGMAFSLPLHYLSSWQLPRSTACLPRWLSHRHSSWSFLLSLFLNSFLKKRFPWQHCFPGLSRLQKPQAII